jgi:signal recognition particle GTPase
VLPEYRREADEVMNDERADDEVVNKHVENEIISIDEDVEILDAIWDRLAKEEAERKKLQSGDTDNPA